MNLKKSLTNLRDYQPLSPLTTELYSKRRTTNLTQTILVPLLPKGRNRKKMLLSCWKQGVIQPSSNLFSLPLFLVRNANDSQRMCIDFRTSNHETMNDKFPMLVEAKVFFFPNLTFHSDTTKSGWYHKTLKRQLSALRGTMSFWLNHLD